MLCLMGGSDAGTWVWVGGPGDLLLTLDEPRILGGYLFTLLFLVSSLLGPPLAPHTSLRFCRRSGSGCRCSFLRVFSMWHNSHRTPLPGWWRAPQPTCVSKLPMEKMAEHLSLLDMSGPRLRAAGGQPSSGLLEVGMALGWGNSTMFLAVGVDPLQNGSAAPGPGF